MSELPAVESLLLPVERSQLKWLGYHLSTALVRCSAQDEALRQTHDILEGLYLSADLQHMQRTLRSSRLLLLLCLTKQLTVHYICFSTDVTFDVSSFCLGTSSSSDSAGVSQEWSVYLLCAVLVFQ